MRLRRFIVALLAAALCMLGLSACSESEAACFSGNGSDSGNSSTTGAIPAGTDLFAAIKDGAQGNQQLILSGLMGSYLESGWDVNDTDGQAVGYWQIQLPGVSPGPHPDISVAQARDVAFSTNLMLPAYSSALKTVSPNLWESDPKAAAEETAYKAERPAQPYHVHQGQSRVDEAYAKSLSVMKDQLGVEPNFAAAPSTSDTTAVAAGSGGTCDPYAGTGSGNAAEAVAAAEKYLGTPYVYGGGGSDGPSKSGQAHGNPNDVGFDCSGLTQFAYNQAGMKLPRTSQAQWEATKANAVPQGQEQPGDLIFFGSGGGGPTHVGMVVDPGRGMMINAPQTGKPVGYANYRQWGDIVGITHNLSTTPPADAATASTGSNGTSPASGQPANTSGVPGQCIQPGPAPVIVLDPGHSPDPSGPSIDPGSNVVTTDSANHPEMERMYDLAVKQIAPKLCDLKYTVIITKKSVDDYVDLKRRADIANQAHAALEVSLHTSPGGTEQNNVFYPKVGELRYTQDGATTPEYNNGDLSNRDKGYAETMAGTRQQAEGEPVKATSYFDRFGLRIIKDKPPLAQKGSVLTSQYFAQVPTVYCEKGDNGLGADGLQQYANGVIDGVKAIAPIK